MSLRIRAQDTDRPLPGPYQFRYLYKLRQKGHRQANVRVNTSRKPVVQIASEIHAALRAGRL